MSEVTPNEVRELVSSVRDLTSKVQTLVERMDHHGKVLFGPDGDEGLFVRFTKMESRVSALSWAGALIVTAIVIAAVSILVARAMEGG